MAYVGNENVQIYRLSSDDFTNILISYKLLTLLRRCLFFGIEKRNIENFRPPTARILNLQRIKEVHALTEAAVIAYLLHG